MLPVLERRLIKCTLAIKLALMGRSPLASILWAEIIVNAFPYAVDTSHRSVAINWQPALSRMLGLASRRHYRGIWGEMSRYSAC